MNEGLNRNVLVVDDEENLRLVLRNILEDEGFCVSESANGLDALRRLDQEVFDFILCDVKMPKMDGTAFLAKAREKGVLAPIIMLSAYGTVESAVSAIKAGAFDYVFKPFQPDEIVLTLRRAEEQIRLKNENLALRRVASQKENAGIIARSKAMADLMVLVGRVAQVKSPVLITGESGTGKELVARAVHQASSRQDMPFVAVNCGAIPDRLLESELFGHEKGAFTDAVKERPGLFREADKGTLFLDEVAELPLALQVKLLRVLQFEEVRPVGSASSLKVDVRIIAATAKDPVKEVEASRFREDLYYRLNVLPLHIRPLRERPEDIPELLKHFLIAFSARMDRDTPDVSPEVMETLMRYDWPGNVRELENLVDRILVLSPKPRIEPADLPSAISRSRKASPTGKLDNLDLKAGIRDLEEHYIREALDQCQGNRSEAARRLGISYPSLLSKIKTYEIE